MKELEKEFIGTGEVKAFKFSQILRNDYAFIYFVTSFSEDNIGLKTHYEVFECKSSKECDMIIGGVNVHFEEKEIYPKANSFGIWAWTYIEYDKALSKFNEITQNVIDRINKQQLT